MRSLAPVVLAAAAVLLSTAAHAASPGSSHGSSPSDPFGTRLYVRAGDDVVVGARPDLLAVKSALSTDAVAARVEAAALKAAPAARVARVFVVHRDGLVAVEFADPLERASLAALAHLVEGDGVRVYPVLSRETGRAFYDDHLVVTAAPGRLDAVVAAVVDKTGGALVRKSSVPNTALVSVGAAFHEDAVDASAALSRAHLDGLVSAEPDLYRELRPTAVVPNDPLFAQQWHLSRQDGSVPGTGQIFADVAWDTTEGDPSTVVAVFDTGIDVHHPDLEQNMLKGFDAADNDDDPSPECSVQPDGAGEAVDCPGEKPFRESHGTSVSGIIAAVADNGSGVSGVCPHCMILPVRILGDNAQSGLGIAEAFVQAVDLGADVINNSWGPGFSLFFPLSTAEQDAFDYARDEGRDGEGTVILFASGNNTQNVANDAYASNPYVISVAATTNVDDWALYSNFGAEVDVSAPSQGLPADQDGFADDDFGIVTTDLQGPDGYDPGDDTTEFNGTSAASPVASGVAALVVTVNPSLTAEQVRLILTRSADKVTADKFPWSTFFSQDDQDFLFPYDDTGHSNAFGFGRVNAAAAVALAQNPGSLEGAFCDAPGCDFCSPEGRCLTRCTQQSDCVDGSVCNTAIGACELPRLVPGTFRAVCSADCATCTPTLDSQFDPVEVCTKTCGSDDDCPDGFDCRLTEEGGPSVCGIGDKSAGGPADFFNCFDQELGASLVVTNDDGRQLCGDLCFGDGPGACPYGFSCRPADCTCAAGSQAGCFAFTCGEANGPNDPNLFPFSVCQPDPGFADTCKSDIDCQAGDYCQGGHCRLDDRDGCDVCAPCSSNADCQGRGVCFGLRDGPVGQCIWDCEDSDPCPGDSECRAIAFGQRTIQACVSPNGGTDAATRCDPGYSCSVPCRDDVPCPGGQTCQDGACVDAGGEGEGEGEGAPGISGGGCACGSTDDAPAAFALAVAALVWRRRRRALPG